MIRFLVAIVMVLSFVGSASALTMGEAVRTALMHNSSLERQRQLARSAEELAGVARAPFYPSLDLKYSYTKSSEDIYSPEDELSVFTAEASYMLFTGLSDMNTYRSMSAQAQAAEYRAASARADLILAVKSAYIEVLRAHHAVETSREGVELLDKQLADARRFFEVGLIAKKDLLTVEVELASARQDLVQAEGGYRVARSRLERLMGFAVGSDVQLEDFGDAPEQPSLSFEPLRDEMLGRRSELKYLRAELDAAEYQIQAVKGGFFPSISVAMQYNQYGDGPSPSGRDESYDSDTRTMVNAHWNLFQGGVVFHAEASAHALRRAANAQLLDTERELTFQLREVLEGYGVSREKLNVARAAVAQAEENYRVTESSFKHNVATTTDLLDARTLLSRARTQYFGALYDLHLSQARLERALEREE